MSFKINARECKILVAFGFFFAISSLLYYASFKYMDAGLASTLLFLYPLEVAVIMSLFFKEKMKKSVIVSIVISMVGVSLLYNGDSGFSVSSIGWLLVFISSFTYSIYIVMANRVNLQMGSVKMTF